MPLSEHHQIILENLFAFPGMSIRKAANELALSPTEVYQVRMNPDFQAAFHDRLTALRDQATAKGMHLVEKALDVYKYYLDVTDTESLSKGDTIKLKAASDVLRFFYAQNVQETNVFVDNKTVIESELSQDQLKQLGNIALRLADIPNAEVVS